MTAALRQHLLASRICGDVTTDRYDNLRNIRRLLDGHPSCTFGLPVPDRTSDEVLEVMVRRCGIHPDPSYDVGPDTIDVDLCVAALVRVRDRLADAVAGRQRVVLATGHPTGILAIHLAVAAALTAAGCEVLRPDVDAWQWPWDHDSDWARRRPRHIRNLGGVHLLAAGGELVHTHAPDPGVELLRRCEPDLVVADHGWAGAAAVAGHQVLGFADSNDPALFVGEEAGLPLITVPLDDNVRPHLYDPVSRFLTTW